MASILLLEDDKALHQAIARSLQTDRHTVISAYHIAQAQALRAQYKVDLFLLDINLPDGSGISFCREIRQDSNTPILFLTAKNTEEHMIEGFQAGCDDYIPKPFPVGVLRQKIAAVLRRAGTNGHTMVYKDLEIDYEKMSVRLNGEEIRLTATEYKLLSYLAKNRGRVLTRSILLEQIWDCDGNFIDENTLSVHVRRLRQKIEPSTAEPKYILTVFGIGYTFGED